MNPMRVLLAKLLADGEKLIQPKKRDAWHESTPTKHPQKRRMGFTSNHGKGESKVRKKMADKSRRINQKRNCR
jgi:hypothetical protein